jgi:hypothetical protein
MFRQKMNSSRSIEIMHASPGVFVEAFDSSFRLTDVSQPQYRNNPRTIPAARP